LKSLDVAILERIEAVALFTGAWIEISPSALVSTPVNVALFTGAWIEMGCVGVPSMTQPKSRSLRARGLKYKT